jgi:Winged helix-turn helix
LQDHLVHRGRRDAEVGLHVGLGRWAAIELRVRVDEGQVLALFLGERRNPFFGRILVDVIPPREEDTSMNVRYIVALESSERQQLETLVAGGIGAVRRIKRAQILLATAAGRTDKQIATTVQVSLATVYRAKRRFVEDGMEHALSEDPRPGGKRKLSTTEEAMLVPCELPSTSPAVSPLRLGLKR